MENEQDQEEIVEETSTEEEVVEDKEESKEDNLSEMDYDTLLETAEASKKAIQTLAIQKNKYKEKAEKLAEKNEVEKPKPQETNSDELTREEIVLIANKKDMEVIDTAKLLASAKGITLSEAMKDPVVVAYEAKLDSERKKKDASLGASGKSSTANVEPNYKEGTTKEEHKKKWEEKMKELNG